jgi:hypothetical protein
VEADQFAARARQAAEGSQVNAIRIDIPDQKTSDVAYQAGGIVLDAVREAGLDPVKSAGNPVVRQIIGLWGRGEWKRDQVVKAFRNLAILNPGIST